MAVPKKKPMNQGPGSSAPNWKATLWTELVAMGELEDVLRVSRKRVAELVNRAEEDGSLMPVAKLGVGRIWLRRDVERWNRARLAKLGKKKPPVSRAS
jgi:hypothetical protein